MLNARCIRAVSDNVFMAQSFASNIGFDVCLTVSITSFECCAPSYLSLAPLLLLLLVVPERFIIAYTSMHSTHRSYNTQRIYFNIIIVQSWAKK